MDAAGKERYFYSFWWVLSDMVSQERTLLWVDDEENILRTIKRLYRNDGYRILTASSGREGLEVLKEHAVGVVVSDQRMPEMSGVEFLSQVKELYPETVRVVLSGYTDLESVTEAINKGAIYKFLTKPWDDELLRQNVKEAFRSFELMRENKRLAMELRISNEFLKRANEELEEYTMLNFPVLQASQDVLESLPVGVIGIGDDNVITFANKRAGELLGVDRCDLVGHPGGDALPRQLYALSQGAGDGKGNEVQLVEMDNVGAMGVFPCQTDCPFDTKGRVLAFFPGRSDQ